MQESQKDMIPQMYNSDNSALYTYITAIDILRKKGMQDKDYNTFITRLHTYANHIQIHNHNQAAQAVKYYQILEIAVKHAIQYELEYTSTNLNEYREK
jgi:hypothetical protein